MTASTLRQLINEYRRDGFKVKSQKTKMRFIVEVVIPRHRAMYKQHIEEFMRLGGFTYWNVENHLETKKACVLFQKYLKA